MSNFVSMFAGQNVLFFLYSFYTFKVYNEKETINLYITIQ